MKKIGIADPKQYLANGRLWSDQIAPDALPILLAAAIKGEPITYKQLGEKLHELGKGKLPKSFRNYGKPPGKIGNAIRKLSELWGEPIPPLNAIVVNGASQLPGHGAHSFLHASAITEDEGSDLRAALEEIERYDRWERVADYFGVKVKKEHYVNSKPDPIEMPKLEFLRGGEESMEHKKLKIWVAEHPEVFQSNFGYFSKGINEKVIRSGDRLDVLFRADERVLAIEVKAYDALETEYFRGIFQCVKYRCVLQATQLAEDTRANAQAALVCQRSLPSEVARLAKRLQIKVIRVPKTI